MKTTTKEGASLDITAWGLWYTIERPYFEVMLTLSPVASDVKLQMSVCMG